jgi:alpha 1,3-glucosidase
MEKDPYTLIIGLNLYQVSEGDLYVDDGHSFAFQKGKYLYRQFTFRDYQLTSSQGALPDSQTLNVPDGTFRPENKIEKIIILGLAGGPAKWTVSNNGVELDASPGPIRLNPDLPQNLAMVIRKPGLSISSDWNLKFTKKEQ